MVATRPPLFAFAFALAACTSGREIPSVATTGDDDERALFETRIVPLFEARCGTSACHAADAERLANLSDAYFLFPVDEAGKVTGRERLDGAYSRAKAKLSAEGPLFSDLIRKPLHESLGGREHRGGDQFATMEDEGLVELVRWADLARPAAGDALPPLVQRYRDDVQPMLAKKGCMLSSCHGSSSANFLSFDPGVVGDLDDETTLRNYAKVALMLNFETPDPLLSRAIRKTIPLDQGGIPHRGGNAFFDPGAGDADLAAVADFVTDARLALGDDDKGVVTGLVFVATDATPRHLFDIAAWQPGGDVYTLVPAQPGGTLTNITKGLHTAAADIRDPAVSYDGKRVAFAMRTSLSDCLNLYVMNVDGTGFVQVTHDSGPGAGGVKVSNAEPLWGPDDRLYFTSTRGGKLTAGGGGYPLSNMWRIDADGSHAIQMTFSAANEVRPAWRFLNQPAAERPEVRTLDMMLTAWRGVGDRAVAPIMRVPPDFRSDYHPHYGTQNPSYQIFTSISTAPDHREPVVLMDEADVWEGGALAIIDRNLGPIISDGNEPAVVNFIEGLQPLGTPGETVAHKGFSAGGYYRDPFAMPDGTVVVSHSSDPIDLSDAGASPETALYRLTLAALPQSRKTIVVDKIVLADVAGKVETDPKPIYVRRREEIGDPLEHLTNGATSGKVLDFDMAVQLRVGEQDSPSGTKDFEATAERIRWVRLVEEVAPRPDDYPDWPDTSKSRIGRGRHGIRRVLGEFQALSDRSMFVELPAGVPYFEQALDDTRAASTMFNQWFFVLPGEKLNQVTRREVWNGRCSACHGSISGIAGDTVVKPDILAQASRVEANYDPATDSDKAPVAHGLTPAERIEVDFEADIQPLLTAKCATSGCHGADGVEPCLTKRPGVDGFSGAYEVLTSSGGDSGNGFSYVDPTSSRAHTSYLAEVLVRGELDAPRVYDSSSCPGSTALTLNELATFMRWMDLGASYVGLGTNDPPVLPTY